MKKSIFIFGVLFFLISPAMALTLSVDDALNDCDPYQDIYVTDGFIECSSFSSATTVNVIILGEQSDTVLLMESFASETTVESYPQPGDDCFVGPINDPAYYKPARRFGDCSAGFCRHSGICSSGLIP